MHLKSIEIYGFKSFADRTRIELKTGINGVIGPNGCGKSNIMESIRWCIGEMSWKSLRSDSMVSVIFAGTARRSPMNLCEVTLTFDNAKSLLPVQYSEVQVTRRLFRSGESEYYLNKTQCRLRDIRELFLDTGIGNDGYAIIDQGQVDFMVKSKPEDRRALFEEAAGVAKYKAKRTEALRKLDRVEIDLGRLQDSLSLINEQIKKLDADARKAQLFKKYKEELASLEAGSILREVGQLDQALAAERARLTPLAEQLAELKTKIGGDEARLAALNLERTAQQAQVIELNGRISEAKVETATLEERVKSAEAQTGDTTAQLEGGRKRLAEDEARIEGMAPVIESARAALEDAARRVDAAQADLARFTAEFESLSAERDAASAAVDAARSSVTAAVQDAIAAGRRVSDAESRWGRRQAQLENTRRQTEKAAGRREAVAKQLSESKEAHAVAVERLAAAKAGAEEADASALAARSELEALGRRSLELNSEKAVVSARVEALEAQGSQDPYWVGAQAVTSAGLPGVLGTVRSLIETDEAARRPVEDALGERLYAVVCADRPVARTALELLKGLGRGRARLLVASDLPAPAPAAGGLLDHVRFAPEHEPVVRHLLGGAADEGGALSDGPWLCGGAVSGEAPAAGLADVDTLRSRAGSLASDLTAIVERRGALEAERAQLDGAARDAAKAVREADLAEHRLRDLVESAERSLAHIEEELAGLASEEESLAAEIAQYEAEHAAAKAALGAAQTLEVERRGAEAAAVSALQAAGERLAARRAEKDHLERSVQGLAEQAAFAKRQHADLVESQAGLRRECDERRAAHAAWEERLGELARQRQESLSRIDELRTQLGALENEANALHERVQKTALEADELASAVGRRKADADALQQDLHQGEMRLSQDASRRGFLVQRLQDEWQLTYEDAKSKYAEAEVDAERLEFLRRRIAALGNINMAAPEEYEELVKRRDALKTQVDDLGQAGNDLRSVIAKINATTRENFRQTFAEVREHFRKLYAVLFEGGEADLILTNAEDMLESGVDIVAQPPGKKLQNLSQLSGGEKTLTAIALLFAFFMVKPSPICMLDEADAALDEANVERFVSMLREFGAGSAPGDEGAPARQATQFLIVSHNKKTMEACDAIWGVSMEESGVTQMISVEFRKGGEGRAAEAPALAENPEQSQNREPAGEASAG